MRAVLINTATGIVENAIEYENGVEFAPPKGYTLRVEEVASIGSSWDGAVFTPPIPGTPPPLPPSTEQLLAMTFVAKTTVADQVKANTFPAAKVSKVAALFPVWTVGLAVVIGDIYTYKGSIVKCVQAHTTQADWAPDVTPALWTVYKDPTVASPWKQPTGAQDAYTKDALVTYNGKTWKSNVAANVWAPPTQWTEVV